MTLSPWQFGFVYLVWVPHFAFGLFTVVGAQSSRTDPWRWANPGHSSVGR